MVRGSVPGMSPERRRRVDATRNRDALIAAAARLFAEHGPQVGLDHIAREAGLANATLYRHFPTRAELIVAVYAEEVRDLTALADQLLALPDPGEALDTWLRAFTRHVASRRELAQSLPDSPEHQRAELFTAWHQAMHTSAEQLYERAQKQGATRAHVKVAELLALCAGIALTANSAQTLDALLELTRNGYAQR